MRVDMKLVDFTYCKKCKYYNIPDYDEPCNTCMYEIAREGSRMPINFKGGTNDGNKLKNTL